jgi:hypothetical protein
LKRANRHTARYNSAHDSIIVPDFGYVGPARS